MWCRVFLLTETALDANTIAQHLRDQGITLEVKADTDDRGWFHLELVTASGAYIVDHYGADDGIRDDLNTWAAWLEEHASDQARRLMQHMISTRQLITIRRDDRGDDAEARQIMHALARCLAERGDGIYQLDGEGFFDAAGTRLVTEQV